MSNLTIENVYTRQRAKELTHQHFWKLLGMMLTVLAVFFAASFLITWLTTPAASDEPNALSVVLALLGMLATELVAAGLGLGLTSAMLYSCKDGEYPKISQVFSRMNHCLKAFGLTLWVGLKTFLWMLPVFAVMFFAFGALAFSTSTTTDLYTGTQSIPMETEAATVGMVLLPILLLVLLFALVIPAAYRYMLSSYVLADKPDTGVFECVRHSKAMMKGHKWQAFKLMVPPLLLLYGGMFVVTIAQTLLVMLMNPNVEVAMILSIVFMIALFAFMLYMLMRVSLGYCIFYLNRSQEQETPASEASTETAE